MGSIEKFAMFIDVLENWEGSNRKLRKANFIQLKTVRPLNQKSREPVMNFVDLSLPVEIKNFHHNCEKTSLFLFA